MKRMIVLFVVLALAMALFTGCGANGRYGDGSNVSTTDDGTVNGTNPDGPGVMGGMDDGTLDHAVTGQDGTAGTANGPDGNGQTGGNR